MRHKPRHVCENCPILVGQINELEAFIEWVAQLPIEQFDEIKPRAKEVLTPEKYGACTGD